MTGSQPVGDSEPSGGNKKLSRAPFSLSGAVTVGKDLVALLRDGALLLLAVLLVAWPAAFNDMLVKAGFEEGSVVGFRWKSKLVESDAALKEAQGALADLRTQNDQLTKALAEARTQVQSPELKQTISRLQEANAQINSASSKVQESLKETIEGNEALVQRAQAAFQPSGRLAVVFSGDATLDEARYETETIAPKFNIPNTAVYFRQGMFRSVAIAGSRAEAEQILARAKKRRADAYIVTFGTWCANPVAKRGYFECAAP